MSSNRKLKGAIFRVDTFDHPNYYCAYQQGMSRSKADAYVYTKEEVFVHMNRHWNWGMKDEGTWVLVYE